jgi:hypothetical protein
LDDTQRKAAAEFYGEAAMKVLREAVSKGYTDVAKMNADLAPLRQRQDFQRLVAELNAQLADKPVRATSLILLKPAAGATLENGARDGSKVLAREFDWSDVPGATQYHLYVIGPKSALPSVNIQTLTTSSYRFEAKMHVVDENRLGWRWRVRALVNGTWSDWSEERTFNVAPLNGAPQPSSK